MDELTTVLFPHPGAEHDSLWWGEHYPWTRQDQSHRRKFLRAAVQLADREGRTWRLGGERVAAMWTEFEALTRIQAFPGPPAPGLPNAWHEFLPVKSWPNGAHGTDPWVFGDSFRYQICKQDSVPYLQHLDKGDVLFFGSWMKRDRAGRRSRTFNFFLDTAFVVEAGYAAGRVAADVPKSLLDPAFRRCAWDRIRRRDWRMLYRGAMLGQRPSSKPFSFVPCLPAAAGQPPSRFPRPMISDLFRETSGNGQAIKRLKNIRPDEAWRMVVYRCLGQGLRLAASIASPVVLTAPERAPDDSLCGERH